MKLINMLVFFDEHRRRPPCADRLKFLGLSVLEASRSPVAMEYRRGQSPCNNDSAHSAIAPRDAAMMEKRNRNGGGGRSRTEEPDERSRPGRGRQRGAQGAGGAGPQARGRDRAGAPARWLHAPHPALAGDRRGGAALSLLGFLAERPGHPGRAAGARRHRRQARGQGDGGVEPISPASSRRRNRSRCGRGSAVISNRSISPTARSCKKGDLLFVIEPRPFELALETSKAQLAQTEAQVQLAQGSSSIAPRSSARTTTPPRKPTTSGSRRWPSPPRRATRRLAAVNQAQLNLDYTRVTAPVSGRMGTP